MPKDHSHPINEADRQARAALKAYADWASFGTLRAYPFEMDQRTLNRIYAGKRDVPPRAALALAKRARQDMITERNRDQLEGWAMALELWAEDCQQRSAVRPQVAQR